MGNPKLEPELLMAIGRGEPKALEKLYHNCKEKIFKYIYYKTGDREGAREILQEVFLGIWKSAPTYREEAAPLTWIYALVRRKIADYFREKEREKKIFDKSKESSINGVTNNKLPDYLDIFTSLNGLDPLTREAIICVYYLGFNYEETAEHLEIPVGTLKSRLFYGKKKLRKEIEKGGTSGGL